ncbi:hypothetical protein AHMF7605_10200 [Adhaeribacter arboris]|uniref:Uncharacterized protein n=1 Tax=Adhaeribacter arboris TaxID=2072846 RepID=A0A2T2YEF0_9BACT|nr:hypothetical protein [Adhaeribacter arboris]PSR53863.1 hypothetical protein AHMF7605_10200 [Adhaeribacter arboris]
MVKRYVIGGWLAFLLFIVLNHCREEATIRRNLKVTTGVIKNVTSGYRGGIQIEYCFIYHRKEYQGAGKILISSAFVENFKSKRIPVAFDSLQPENNDYLLLPYDFNKYDLLFPDTLKWVVDLENRSL